MSLELIPLCTATLDSDETLSIGVGPAGRRVVGIAKNARFEGERFKASQRGVAADWLAMDATGTGTIDARVTLETDDGALVYMSYGGRAVFERGVPPTFYITPVFETGDERYAWLNRLQAVGKGTIVDGSLRYELYELS